MIQKICSKKRILFITTKNLDYIRNVQEINLIQENASEYIVIGSHSKSYFRRLLWVYFRLLFMKVSCFELVWIGFAPQLIFPLFWKFKKKIIIIDFFISLYDTLCYDRRVIKSGSLIGKCLYALDKATLNRADYVICDTNAHGEYFIREFQVSPEKLFTLYLQADTSIFYPRLNERPQFLKNKYVILYFGSILPLQGVEIVLKAIDLLKTCEQLFFFFIGPLNDSLRKSRPMSENIQYIDWLSQEKLAYYISWSDLCLAGHFNKEVEKASRTIPGKAFIYQAMGKEMILGNNPANRELFARDEKVIFVEMGDEKALAKAILTRLTDKD